MVFAVINEHDNSAAAETMYCTADTHSFLNAHDEDKAIWMLTKCHVARRTSILSVEMVGDGHHWALMASIVSVPDNYPILPPVAH